MKTVFTDASQVAHLWAHQSQDSAKNAGHNFYFTGDTIYSYGSHFPIARIYNGKVLFTTRGYSNTTSKHIAMVRSACSHMDKIYMPYVLTGKIGLYDDEHNKNLQYWANEIKISIGKLARARKKEIYLSEISHAKSQMQAYIDFFKLKVKAEYKTLLQADDSKGFSEYLSKQQARIKREQAAAKRKDEQALVRGIKNFREFKERNIYNRDDRDYLRYNKELEQVETSQGVPIPVDVAKRIYKSIVSAQKKGMPDDMQILGYSVKEITPDYVKVGCHTLYMDEINSLMSQIK